MKLSFKSFLWYRLPLFIAQRQIRARIHENSPDPPTKAAELFSVFRYVKSHYNLKENCVRLLLTFNASVYRKCNKGVEARRVVGVGERRGTPPTVLVGFPISSLAERSNVFPGRAFSFGFRAINEEYNRGCVFRCVCALYLLMHCHYNNLLYSLRIKIVCTLDIKIYYRNYESRVYT